MSIPEIATGMDLQGQQFQLGRRFYQNIHATRHQSPSALSSRWPTAEEKQALFVVGPFR